MAVTRQQVVELYVATFNRAPDADGLDYWVNLSGLTIEEIAQSFFDQPETQTLYPTGTTDAAFVTSIYSNLFGRTPDAAGLAYWEGELASGNMTRSVMIEAMKNGALGADAILVANKATVGLYYADAGLQDTDFSLASVTAYQSSVEAAIAEVDNIVENGNTGETFSLTTGVDGAPAFTGGAGDDTYTAVIDGTTAANNTWSALDSLDGGAGNDVLNFKNTSAATKDAMNLALGTIKNIETINIQAVGGITEKDNAYVAGTDEVDFSSLSGLTTINTTKSTAALIKAATTTDVNVSGATDLISIQGGKDVVVTNATAGKAITVGDAAAGGDAAGTITITDTNNAGANAIVVEGGTDVTVTATAAAQMTAGITVGHATNGTASGNVTITQNLTSDGAAIDHSAQTIAAVGGKTIAITQNLTNTADIQTDAGALTGAAITATADNATTNVTITQNATNTIFTKPAVTEVKASQAVTFKDLASGETVTVDGLVFTAAKNLTATEVAAAFANLTASDKQSEGGITTNGIYTSNSGASWTSGAANGATVTFTGATNNTATFAVASSAVASVPTKAYTLGTAGAAAIPSTNSVVMGSVVVDDNATKSITTVTVDGATTVTLGGTTAATSLDALATLSLANVDSDVVLNTTATALNLTLNKVVLGAGESIDLDEATNAENITDLTLSTTGAASTITTFTAVAVKNLTVDAGAALTIGTNAISATNVLETVTVKGTAAVALGTIVDSTNLKSFNASANTGGVTATIDASTAASHTDLTTFTFSEGNDVVTLDNAAINKNINLGAGDDSITLAAGVTAITKVIDGGTGTNTIAMTAAQAVTATADDVFEGKITNLQKLSIGSTGVTATAINLANMDDISYVIAAGTGAAGTLGLTNMANNGTLELTAATNATGDVTVTMTDATSLTADVFNIVTKVSTGDVAFAGDVVVAGVETINITATDTDTTAAINKASLIVTATSATTVNVTGNSAVDLALTGSTAVTLIDGSTMTGALTATTAVSTAATTIKGGSAADKLVATSNNDVLMGGAGNDTLIVQSGNLVELNGGAGKDTFAVTATSNQNAYATITGTATELSGDVIQFGTYNSGTGVFTNTIGDFTDAKIVLGATAVFQDYVNEAAKGAIADNTVSYFVWDNDTYLVQNNSSDLTFDNGIDAIVKIAGIVDFTFNDTAKVLEIA